jgi:glutamate-5-semialdehyde dehydrogenase
MSGNEQDLRQQVIAARAAGRKLAARGGNEAGHGEGQGEGQDGMGFRAALLDAFASALERPAVQAAVTAANAEDMTRAREEERRGTLASALVKRLHLDQNKISGVVEGLRQLARMPELVGRRLTHRELDRGLVLERVSCPLGLLGVVFEARPDALVQITGLAWKSGNALVLKGGREARATNRALTMVAHEVLRAAGVDPQAMVLLEDRAEVDALLGLHDLVDLMIARGSSAFIRHVRSRSKIPVMAHADGICHIYLDGSAHPEKSARILVDAKCSYAAACNAVETLLWSPAAAPALDATLSALIGQGVELRACPATRERHPDLRPAAAADWDTEYGALILSVKQVSGLDEALAHIERHGSRHTEAIVAEDPAAARRFLAAVDAACVFHNVSTRFADGYRFGLGAEVGISTDKLHARGPVGVEGLLTYRWLLRGDGQASTDYAPGGRPFTHRDLP